MIKMEDLLLGENMLERKGFRLQVIEIIDLINFNLNNINININFYGDNNYITLFNL